MAAIPTILKGDDSGAITITMATGRTYTGATLVVAYQGVTRSFTNLTPGQTITFAFTHEETSGFELKTSPLLMRLIGQYGAEETVENAEARIRVTDCLAEVNAGGSFIVTPGQAGSDPTKVPITDVGDMAARYSLADLQAKVNQIVHVLAQRSLLSLALSACCLSLFGGVTTQSARLDSLYNDAQVITNVTATSDIPPDYTTTNAVIAISANQVTNNVAPWALAGHTEPQGMTTNAVKGIVEGYGYETATNAAAVYQVKGDYATKAYVNTVSNGAVVAATNAAAADAAGKYLPATKDDVNFYIKNNVVFIRDDIPHPSVEFYGNVSFEGGRNWATDGNTINLGETGFQQIVDVSDTTLQDALDEKADTSSLAAVATSGSYNDLSDKPTIPSLDGYATEDYVDTANATTRAIVQTWEGFLDGSNVVFSITNYISGSYNLNAAKLRILEMTNGVYREVYNSRGEIVMHLDNFKTNDFRVATNKVIAAVNAAVANKADKAWGKYTSAGGDAPSNTVYMTAPNTVFAGGMEYERVAVGEGSVCVLTTKGAPVWTQGDEGTFKFQDDGGTNYFGFAKTDSYVIGANTDGITVQSNIVTLEYDVTMSGVPCIWYKADLATSTPWEQLNTPDGNPIAGASHLAQWRPTPPAGQEICDINCPEAKGFFKATIEVPGSAKFMTNMPADLGGGILCTNTATGVMGKIKPSYNGSQIIWTWSGL